MADDRSTAHSNSGDDRDAARRPAAVIYTHSLLEGSMTFIKSQAEALVRYEPVYAGAHRVPGIELPPERTYVLNRQTPLGVVEEALFRVWGWVRSIIRF